MPAPDTVPLNIGPHSAPDTVPDGLVLDSNLQRVEELPVLDLAAITNAASEATRQEETPTKVLGLQLPKTASLKLDKVPLADPHARIVEIGRKLDKEKGRVPSRLGSMVSRALNIGRK